VVVRPVTRHRPQTAIVGVADGPLGSVSGEHALRMMGGAALDALADAGIPPSEVDGVAVAGFPAVMPGLYLAEYLGLHPRWVETTDVGGSSFELHVAHADAAIAAGLCETVVVLYASTQRQDRSWSLAGEDDPAYTFRMQLEQPTGMPFPLGAYAFAANRHMHEFGTTREQLAEIAVAARRWAEAHPTAYVREPITVDDVLASPPICTPIHALDCCLITDGACAVVITSRERARELRKTPVHVLGYGHRMAHASVSLAGDLVRTAAVDSGAQAFAMAGLGVEDVDVAEVYDSFTITVLLALEDLGFCAKGEGGAFVERGRLAPGGALPVNTNGGGLSHGHPGRLGLFLLVEAVRQLRGEALGLQVDSPTVALCHGSGGVLSSAATVLLGSDAAL
jgi:acetyl-CoA acetyltransferase